MTASRHLLGFVIIYCDRTWPNRYDEEQVAGPYDLLQFLRSFEQFPHLARLSTCDPYDDTPIDGPWLDGLIDDINELLDLYSSGVLQLVVPEKIGDPPSSTAPPEPFDETMFVTWLHELMHLAKRVRSMNIALTAAGD